jgi:hypothetical protein
MPKGIGKLPLFMGRRAMSPAVTETTERLQPFEAGAQLVTVVAGRAPTAFPPDAIRLVGDAEMFVTEVVDGKSLRRESSAAVGAPSLLPLPELPANFRLMQNAPGEIPPSAVFAVESSGLSQAEGAG